MLSSAAGAALFRGPVRAVANYVLGSSVGGRGDEGIERKELAGVAWKDWGNPLALPPTELNSPLGFSSQPLAEGNRDGDSNSGMEIRSARLNGSEGRRRPDD
jgi:hypothetical protein